MNQQIPFEQPAFLCAHIESILAFYEPNIDDPAGGFFQNFSDDGHVYDSRTRHLVSSCRFIFNYARAYLQFSRIEDLERVKSGVNFLRKHHLNNNTKGYYWLLDVDNGDSKVKDDANHCYGLAFVILAYSWALRAGIEDAKIYLYETWCLMEKHFWEPEFGLYMDEANADFSKIDPYRGQNANMHSCEAFIAAYEATQDQAFLNRAMTLANNIVNRQASLSDGFIWEHFHSDWSVNWDYNKDDPKNLFRPWGFQPGHHTEWAKLLLILHHHQPNQWLVARAKSLFHWAMESSWDEENGGICYGFAPDYSVCDGEKYFWVQAESIACAAYLAVETQDPGYWEWYQKIWEYVWRHFVDHQYGAWFRILSNDNQKLETTKSPVGKTDYHTMGACYDVLRALSWRDK